MALWPVAEPTLFLVCAHPFAVGQRLSRLLLFPLVVTVHLIVQELLRKQSHAASPPRLKAGALTEPRGPAQTGREGSAEPRPPACALTLSWAQGSLGWMTVVVLFHVPQYAGRWFSENCRSFILPNFFLSGTPSALPLSTITTSLGTRTALGDVFPHPEPSQGSGSSETQTATVGHREEGSAPCGGAGGQTGSLSSRGAAERFRRLTEAEEKLDEAPKPGPVTWEAGAWLRPQRASSGQNPELSHQRQLRPRKRH